MNKGHYIPGVVFNPIEVCCNKIGESFSSAYVGGVFIESRAELPEGGF
jgi:hypothetical protein